jgi:EmrB/QacA subfamily drug resistance transporter
MVTCALFEIAIYIDINIYVKMYLFHTGVIMKTKTLLIAIYLASFLGCLDLTIVNTALPSIHHNLAVPLNLLQWVMTGLLLALAASMVLVGRLADAYGYRRLLLNGLWIFGLASLLAAVAMHIQLLIAARILQGVGIAILYTAPMTAINHLFPKDKIAKAMGLYFAVCTLGIASGPLLGGFILYALNWHWIFFLNIPIVIFSWIICYMWLPKQEFEQHERFDIWGAIVSALGLLSLLLFTTHMGAWGLLSFKSLGFLSAAIILLGAFIYIEKKQPAPMLNLTLFHYDTFSIGGICNIGLAAFYCVAFFMMPLYLHIVRGFDNLHIGLMLLPATLMVALVSPFVNNWVERYGIWLVLAFGFASFTLSAVMQYHLGASSSIYFILVSYAAMGLGWACILSPSFTAAMLAVPKADSGAAMGALSAMHNAGGSIGLSVGVMLFDLHTSTVSAPQFMLHQKAPFLFIASLSACLTLVLLWYRKRVSSGNH